MASSFKTPGVYVEEVAKFPPSVAQVETAIPAFIGYTDTATEYTTNDLLNVPKKIASLLEFERFFGGAPSSAVTSVDLDNSNQVTSLNLVDNHYLYEALRLFYANGGGDCYIVSVGNYQATIQNGNGTSTPGFKRGLNALRKVDEPTLLLAPDAPLMAQAEVNSLYTEMLAQCAELQDRFCIFDLRKSVDSTDFQVKVQDFRDGIGMSNLKYGAVYASWLKSALQRSVSYADFKGNIKRNGVGIQLPVLLGVSTPAGQLATRLDNLVTDQETVTGKIETLKGSFTSMQDRFDKQVSLIQATTDNDDAIDALEEIAALFMGTEDFLLDVTGGSELTDSPLTSNIVTQIGSQTTTMLATLKNFLADAVEPYDSSDDSGGPGATINRGVTYAGGTANGTYFSAVDEPFAKIQGSLSQMQVLWGQLKSMFEYIVTTTDSFESTIETAAIETIPVVKNIIRSIATEALVLPPSAAIAGVYARVDNARGVWKAPANESLNSVIGVTEVIDNRQQEGLNVDVVAGKSVNAIRPFTGKGIMVWGGRTLAGNDNEWRYINVRRLFIMAEESIRKATDQFVFESNDANTWVRLKGMIDNYLTNLWRSGALAGAKPEQAFYVKIGLNQTMSADDILNGILNVEIGLAAVRPAEFIVLKFSHKMQEA